MCCYLGIRGHACSENLTLNAASNAQQSLRLHTIAQQYALMSVLLLRSPGVCARPPCDL